MLRTILYYPSIEIVNSHWIKKSILYWDKIGSIVPRDLDRRFLESETMRFLRNEEVYNPYRPEAYIERDIEFQNEFINTHKSLRRKSLLAPHINDKRYFKVYEGKFPENVKEYLLVNKYALKNRGWLIMNRTEGLLYMSILAKYLSDQDPNNISVPSTDYFEYRNFLYNPSSQFKSNVLGGLIRLIDLLPVPREDVSIKRVLEFRRKREMYLFHFQEVIDEHLGKIRSAKSTGEIKEILIGLKTKLSTEIINLDKLFRAEKLPITYGFAEALLKVEIPAAVAWFTSLKLDIPVWIPTAGVAIGGAISLRKYYLDESNKRHKALSDNYYSYLYLAQKENIIKST